MICIILKKKIEQKFGAAKGERCAIAPEAEIKENITKCESGVVYLEMG